MNGATVDFVDTNATIGRLSAPVFGSWLTAPALIAEMDRFRIRSAAVTHAYGRELDAERGNAALAAAIASTDPENERLFPVATVFPPHGQVDPSIEEQLQPLRRFLRLAVRLHPNPTHDMMDEDVHPRHFPLVSDVVGATCELLAEAGVALFLEMAETRWEEIYALCRDFPALRVLMLGVSYTHKRSLYVGLERYPNLHVELSGFHVQEGIEEAVTSFGPKQLLFGTRLPKYSPASAIAMVQYAAIDDTARSLIAGGNALRLLARCRP